MVNTQHSSGERDPLNVERIASEKLERLLSPDFKEFGVRYMVDREYVSRLGGKWDSSEMVYCSGVPFSDWLKDSVAMGWYDKALQGTDWTHSLKNLQMHDTLSGLLHSAHEEVRTNVKAAMQGDAEAALKGGPKTIRDRTIRRFYELVGQQQWNIWPKIDIHQMAAEFLENSATSKSDVRTLFDRSRDVFWYDWGDGRGPETGDLLHQPYQVALVMDMRGIDVCKETKGTWFNLTSHDKPSPDAFMGAITLFNDRDLTRRLLAADQASEGSAHPFFDRTGAIRWPKQS